MENPNKKKANRNLIFIALIVAILGVAVISSTLNTDNLEEVSITQVIERANKGEIERIHTRGSEVEITVKGESEPTQKSYLPPETNLLEQVTDNRVEISGGPSAESGFNWQDFIFLTILPIALILGVLMFIMRQAQGQGNQAMGFGRSKAKLFGPENKPDVKFDDIAGQDHAKQDLEEVVEYLKTPKKFIEVGAKIPRGVLMVGPPGTGKTMLSRAVAGEAGVPFFSISGSEFVEMFVGVGASRVRDLFNKAKKSAPCIIFVDEIDAVGRRRGSGMGGGHDEREQTLNQILVEMDGFEKDANVIVLAATNRADVLDPALLRPGRFDRRVNISLPDRLEREAILKVHFKNKPADSTVDVKALSAKTAGSSGADLANIANEAAINAARHDRKTINNDDVTEAFEKVAIGPERKSKIMSEGEKEMTAYHEAGHAIVGTVAPDSDPVHKVTIIPRGGTGGVNWFIPAEDKNYHSIIEYKDVLARSLGGRIAEEVIYGSERVTTGAGNDLQKATALARDMVIEQGMGKKLRNQVFHEDEGGMMFDRMTHSKPYSEATAKLIDEEVEALITESAMRAKAIIEGNRKLLDDLKDALLEHETLNEQQVKDVLKGAKLPAAAKLY